MGVGDLSQCAVRPAGGQAVKGDDPVQNTSCQKGMIWIVDLVKVIIGALFGIASK